MLESCANRRKNVRLVAEVVCDRQGKISRSKVDGQLVMFKTSKAPVTPGLRPGYDLPATETCWNRGQIVERTYDWSQRSWVIAKAKSVAARSMVNLSCSKLLKPQSHRAYDQVTAYLRPKNVGIVGKS